MVSRLMKYICVTSWVARLLDVNVLRRPTGDHQSDHHLVVGKVRVKCGRFPTAQEEEVRTVVRFERLVERD